MKKENMTVLTDLPLSLKVLIARRLVDSHFTVDDETGEIEYTPYYEEMTEIICFAQTIVSGLKFEDDENIYDAVKADEELMDIFRRFRQREEYVQLLFDVDDMVEFKKKQLLNAQSATVATLLSDLVKKQIDNEELTKQVLEQQKSINSQYTKEETLHIADVFDTVNKLSTNPEYLKAIASVVHTDKTIKSLQGNKKKAPAKKKAKVSDGN